MIKLYTSTEVPMWKWNAYLMHFENFQKSRVLNIPTNFKCIGLSMNEYFSSRLMSTTVTVGHVAG